MRTLALLALACLSAVAHVRGETLAKECKSNEDCSEGAWCVAGDSETPVQRCVAGAPCGGLNIGSCPTDPATGQLACIWRPDAKACSGKGSAGCKAIGGELGIYKCISLDRCDKYLGNALCSGASPSLVCCSLLPRMCMWRARLTPLYDAQAAATSTACSAMAAGTAK